MLKKIKELLKRLNGGTSSGFTLIEVVIVLAIAGLIFVIVFFAVSQAQASRRDTERKTAATRFLAAVSQYAGNSNGSIPTDGWDGSTYFDAGNGDPDTGSWTFTTAEPVAAGQIYFNATATCPATPGTGYGTGTGRQYAVKVFQEKGTSYCIDSE